MRVSGICMLETNVNNFSERKNYQTDLKTETNGVISDKNQGLFKKKVFYTKQLNERHAANLKQKSNSALKKTHFEKLNRREEKDYVFDFQGRMNKTILN